MDMTMEETHEDTQQEGQQDGQRTTADDNTEMDGQRTTADDNTEMDTEDTEMATMDGQHEDNTTQQGGQHEDNTTELPLARRQRRTTLSPRMSQTKLLAYITKLLR